MELLLKRQSTGDDSTIGTMHMQWSKGMQFKCFTMEDQPNEPKVKGETRIPAGRYKIELRTEGGMTQRYAQKFDFHQGMLWLQDVPDFTFVYIHYGNYEKDTDGCILVGDGAQSNVLEDGMVTASVASYSRLYQEIVDVMSGGEEVWITVEDYA